MWRCILSAIAAVAFFFFSGTATTGIYTLSLHDALPILHPRRRSRAAARPGGRARSGRRRRRARSEEHTSELQSRSDPVCRLLLEKKDESLPIPETSITKWPSYSRGSISYSR